MKKHIASLCLTLPAIALASQFTPTHQSQANLIAAQKVTNNLIYQYDPNLEKHIANNSLSLKAVSALSQANQAATDQMVNRELIQPLETIKGAHSKTTPSHMLNQLTTGLPADDALTTSKDKEKADLVSLENALTATPSTTGSSSPYKNANGNFSFSSLIAPLAYTQPYQKHYVQHYLDYINQSYQPIISSSVVNFKALGMPSTKELSALENSSSFKKLWATFRSIVAARSIANSNFQYLIAERTPSSSLGNLSPLQLQSTTVNSRFGNPKWYQEMSTASPATLQRETLFVLVNIEHELLEAHLNRDRVLGTLSAMQLANTEQSAMKLKLLGSAVNQEIKKITGNTKKESAKAIQSQNQEAEAIYNKKNGK